MHMNSGYKLNIKRLLQRDGSKSQIIIKKMKKKKPFHSKDGINKQLLIAKPHNTYMESGKIANIITSIEAVFL